MWVAMVVPLSCDAVTGVAGSPGALVFGDRGRGTELRHQGVVIGLLWSVPGGTGLIVLDRVVSRFAWLVGLVVCRGFFTDKESESCRQTGTHK